MPNQHPIERAWKSLRKWLRSGSRCDPGLQDAEIARRFAQRTPPPKPAVIGGVDEPDIAPMRRGQRARIFIDAARVCHAEALESCETKVAVRAIDRFLCIRPELNN